MELYKIKINSAGNGWKDEKSTSGTVEAEGERITVNYSLDGDMCTFSYCGGKAVQRRRGGQNIEISFEEGGYTQCVIGEGDLAGAFKVFTRSLIIKRGKGGFRIILNYESGEDRENIKLQPTAVKSTRGNL